MAVQFPDRHLFLLLVCKVCDRRKQYYWIDRSKPLHFLFRQSGRTYNRLHRCSHLLQFLRHLFQFFPESVQLHEDSKNSFIRYFPGVFFTESVFRNEFVLPFRRIPVCNQCIAAEQADEIYRRDVIFLPVTFPASGSIYLRGIQYASPEQIPLPVALYFDDEFRAVLPDTSQVQADTFVERRETL